MDTFTYSANDGTLPSNTATVTISVGINTPPVANNDSYSTPANTPLTVAVPGLLTNDTDLDNDPLTAVFVTNPTNGTLTLNPNGSFTYTPAAGYSGLDSFTYQANDGTANSNTATVTIGVNVKPPTTTTNVVQLPAPPPATLCTLTNFENPGMIRSHFLNDIDRDQLYCRLIAANGTYMTWYGSPLTSAANIGNQSVLDLGIVAAVDVFSMIGRTAFVDDVDICLKGSGYVIFLDANGAPRIPQLWTGWTTNAFPGYTCATLHAPGTVVLVAIKPQ
jgi:VCBS repeat-containing protein